MNDQGSQQMTDRLCMNGWIVFAAFSLAGWLMFPSGFALGIMVGGLPVALSLHLLRRTARKLLTSGVKMTYSALLSRYYLRFLLIAAVFYILLSRGLVDALGLLLGISTFPVNILVVFVQETTRLIVKKRAKEAV